MEKNLSKENAVIVQKNDFITHTTNDMTLNEAKVFYLLISCIQKDDERLPKICVNYKELRKIIGATRSSLQTKKQVEAFLFKLSKEVFYERKGTVVNIRPIFSVIEMDYDEKNDLVYFEFNESLKPYFLKLINNFTMTKLATALSFSSVSTLHLYNLFSCLLYKDQEIYFSVDQIRQLMNFKNEKIGIDKFANITKLRSKFLDPSIAEINEKSDLFVQYRSKKNTLDSRKIEGFFFNIEKKSSFSPEFDLPSYTISDGLETGNNRKELRYIMLK